MILLDTSILIRYIRTADPKILGVITANPVAVSVVTRAEILHGAKNETDFRRLEGVLNRFVQATVEPDAWDDLSRRRA